MLFSPGFLGKMLGNAPLVLPLLDSQGIVKLSTDCLLKFQITMRQAGIWELGPVSQGLHLD